MSASPAVPAAPRPLSREITLAFGMILTFALATYFVGALSFLRIYYVFVGIAAGCAFLILAYRGSLPRRLLHDGRLIGALYVYFLITTAWAIDPAYTLQIATFDLIYPTIWLSTFVFVRFSGVTDPYILFRTLPWVVAALYAYLLLRFGMIRPDDLATAKEIGALGNAGALTLLACLPFVLLRAIRGRRFAMLETMLTLGLLVLSQSRTGYALGAIILAASCIAYRPLGRSGIIRISSGVSAAVLLGVLFVAIGGGTAAIESTIERFTSVQEFVNTDSGGGGGSPGQAKSEVERIAMYVEAFNAWRESPWLGIGYENLGIYVEQRHGFMVVSHNLLITLIAEAGLPSLLLFGIIIRSFWRHTGLVRDHAVNAEARDLAAAARVAMVGLIVGSMAHPLLHFQMFFVVLGIGSGLHAPLSALKPTFNAVRRRARREVRYPAAVSA
jgi:O-antigen ligase